MMPADKPDPIGRESMDALSRLALQSLRSGSALTDDEASALDSLPTIDTLRTLTKLEDLEWLLPLIQSATDATAGLACSLVRQLIEEPGVAQSMISRWEVATPYLKNRIMWRLLEYSALASDWPDRFLQFVLENRDVFDEFNLRFYGPSEEGLARILGRIKNETFPAKKKWIYYLCIPSLVVDEATRASQLEDGLRDGDEFSRKAIRAYKERFGNG